jgi:hypothetical protein
LKPNQSPAFQIPWLHSLPDMQMTGGLSEEEQQQQQQYQHHSAYHVPPEPHNLQLAPDRGGRGFFPCSTTYVNSLEDLLPKWPTPTAAHVTPAAKQQLQQGPDQGRWHQEQQQQDVPGDGAALAEELDAKVRCCLTALWLLQALLAVLTNSMLGRQQCLGMHARVLVRMHARD